MVLEHRAMRTPHNGTRFSLSRPRWDSRAGPYRTRQAESDRGLRAGPKMQEHDKIRELEREVRELRPTNEMLRKASAYFAEAQLDRLAK
jgi:transposase